MILKQTFRTDGYGRPFVITIPAHANTSADDLLRNAEDAIRPLRHGYSIHFRASVGYAGEPGASAPSILITGEVQAGQNHDIYASPGSAMNVLVKVAREVAQYLPACLLTCKKRAPSIRIQYEDQDIYLGRETAQEKLPVT